ncbi:type II methionyl aminopeptidase [archaeon CG10_big_fil_rev_8_21_14_0_10_43_11]|nr:MAG: type II methionyl aminopeptidase [archaeon CG10_big_fil_rev_8_21_14_0_10_43_11]
MDEKKVIEAGQVGARVLAHSASLVKAGARYLDIAKTLEKKILDSGAGIAFPVNISVNEVAAHGTARFEDERVIKKGDVVKIDLGAHIDGHISDNARTFEIGTNKHEKLIACVRDSLTAALGVIKTGAKISAVGAAVQPIMDKYGFNTVRNLVGHSIEPYCIHAGVNVPNYTNKGGGVFKDGMQIAIEPYATYGEGFAINGKDVEIFMIENIRPVRVFSARKILDWIKKERNTLPFSRRWVLEEFGKSANLALLVLTKQGIIKEYPVLVEASGGIVSQQEHTVLVKEKPIVTTKLN